MECWLVRQYRTNTVDSGFKGVSSLGRALHTKNPACFFLDNQLKNKRTGSGKEVRPVSLDSLGANSVKSGHFRGLDAQPCSAKGHVKGTDHKCTNHSLKSFALSGQIAADNPALTVDYEVLSKHIAAMEEELNCKLFVRDSHHVRLTDQRKSFKDDAQGIISQYDKALTRLKAISDSYETVINIGYMRNASRPFLTKFVTTMAQHHPEIRVALCCMEYGEELYSLSTGGIDMAFSASCLMCLL